MSLFPISQMVFATKSEGAQHRGRRERRNPRERSSRAPGGDGGTEALGDLSLLYQHSTYSLWHWIIKFSCSAPFLHRSQGCRHSRIRILSQPAGWEKLRSEIQGKACGHSVGSIITTFIGDRWGHLLYRSNITPFSSHLIPFSLLINL